MIKEFENKFAKFANGDAGFSFWKARVAMYAILKAMGTVLCIGWR